MFSLTAHDPLLPFNPRRILRVGLAALVLTACAADESDEAPDAKADAILLRGGAELTLRPGTALDLDELDSREYYGATITDDLGHPWFIRVERISDDILDELGLDHIVVDGASARVGAALADDGSSDHCLVHLPFAIGATVALSRIADDDPCPEGADELHWLPEVHASDDDIATVRAFGSVVGSFSGITAYSNNSTTYDSGSYSTVGLKWQCVEYANRYVYQKLGHKNLKGTGNAEDYFGTAGSKGLTAYANGGTTKPKVGDMLPSAGGSFGHIAIVREVGPDYVKVIHQNWSNSSSDDSKTLSMSTAGGKYTVSGFSGSYPVQGWLRKTSCSPSVSSVSPTSAKLNTTTSFTVSGSCLPTTTVAWIANCVNMTVTSTSSSQMKFSCRPSYSTGAQSAVVKHATDGTVLKNFSVSVY